ncbi:MAG: N-acetyltransferase [Glaciihabitans sp.]|nr:N-acetyltransferase [Glaciihabitans sp.]
MTSQSSVVVREPAKGDAAAIARVHVQGWRDAYSHLLPESFYNDATLRQRTRMWRAVLRLDVIPSRLRVAVLGGVIVGVALAGRGRGDNPPRALELYLIYVTSEVYGLGAGQALLEAVLGDEPAQLWVAEENPRARAFYLRNGFTFDGTMDVAAAAGNMVEMRLVR